MVPVVLLAMSMASTAVKIINTGCLGFLPSVWADCVLIQDWTGRGVGYAWRMTWMTMGGLQGWVGHLGKWEGWEMAVGSC